MENRIDKALELFDNGYNCAQSVFVAYADLFDIERNTALKLSTSFGGGMGGMRNVCGAVSGMFMVAGLKTGTSIPRDREGKKRNYDTVQLLADKFTQENGSIICSQLLGLEACPTPLKKKPCREYIRFCAELLETNLKKEI
ncbi:C-GCAxxG-C-C family protein [Dysgonomonas sp. ZJ279]|uniref:C-GCAxxG-C-C family protein n=1 Tax=Dysgonomonas sp. ZJ279 TaxID=2709796 RepID=UPI0013ED2A64|nr:C-GCAxxG-C-C family protein [Dysgonomonas sp. ZJ279]